MFRNLFSEVEDIIKDWKPQYMSNENQYRDDLVIFLRRELKEAPNLLVPQEKLSITKEDGRGLCDIAVDRRIGIELKKDLEEKKEIDRLAGQIMDYKKDYEDIIIVLVGKINADAVDVLNSKIDDLKDEGGISLTPQKNIIVIEKPDSKQDEREYEEKESGLFGNIDFGLK